MDSESPMIDLVATGEILRKKRKEMRKTLEDLADEQMSIATISNIERGLPNVRLEKVYYYAKKLGLRSEGLMGTVKQNIDSDKQTESILTSIQSTIESGNVEEGLGRLQSLNIADSSPHYPFKLYLLGRCHLIRRKLTKASHFYVDSLRLADKFSSLNQTNLKSLCYFDLARIFYYKNDFQNALSYTQRGIDCYNPEGETTRRFIIYSLRVSKAIYLEKLDRLAEALQTIDDLWEEIDKIESVYVRLNMYEAKSDILKRQKRYSEAIQFAKEGIELARINWVFERLFDLWNTLGSIYLEKKELDEAENCIRTALSMKKRIDNEYLLVYSYTLLGLLCMKQERWEEAFHALDKAVHLGEKTNDAKRLVTALIVLGDWYRLKEKYLEAIEVYKKADAISKEHHFTKQRHMVLIELSKCLKYVDKDQFRESLENLFDLELQLTQDRTL